MRRERAKRNKRGGDTGGRASGGGSGRTSRGAAGDTSGGAAGAASGRASATASGRASGERRPWRLLVTGGGTGGHIYPALAIARRAQERYGPVTVLYVGARGGLEAGIVPAAGYDFAELPVSGLVRRRFGQRVAGLWHLGAAELGALSLVRRFRPDVVVGTGGYAAGPVGVAAWLLGVPLVLQEQNAVPGVTNRLLSRVAVGVALPHRDAAAAFPRRARTWIVGNPVRNELVGVDGAAARERMGLPAAGPVVLMVAGSRGSAAFVRLFAEWMQAGPLPACLVFVAGRAHDAAAREATSGGKLPPGVRIVPYLDEVGDAYAAADLVIARAGAMTLAELALLGKPAVLIPSPHVTHHHQDANAAVLERAGAAVVLREEGLQGGRLGTVVAELLDDRAQLDEMAAASRALGRSDALDDLVERVHALAAGAG